VLERLFSCHIGGEPALRSMNTLKLAALLATLAVTACVEIDDVSEAQTEEAVMTR